MPCLYWNHGGGFVMGRIEQGDELLCHLVEVLQCCAFSVEWRHAPENRFPAAVRDSYRGLVWVWENAPELGADPGRLVVGGASAGGGLAASTALIARDNGHPGIHHQLLIYSMLDDRMLTASSQAITCSKVWNRTTNAIAWDAYLGPGHESRDVSPYAAPARAAELSGLPPAFIGVGALDVLVDENINYAQRLIEAEVPTELHVYPGAAHGFNVHAPTAAVSRQLASDYEGALRRAFYS
jgi:acetyl esterase/lipase